MIRDCVDLTEEMSHVSVLCDAKFEFENHF